MPFLNFLRHMLGVGCSSIASGTSTIVADVVTTALNEEDKKPYKSYIGTALGFSGTLAIGINALENDEDLKDYSYVETYINSLSKEELRELSKEIKLKEMELSLNEEESKIRL